MSIKSQIYQIKKNIYSLYHTDERNPTRASLVNINYQPINFDKFLLKNIHPLPTERDHLEHRYIKNDVV